MMRLTSDSVKLVRVCSMNGSSASSETRMTSTLGTKVSVISWICVSACRKAMPRPTASAISMIGAPSFNETTMVSCAMSMTSVGLIRLRASDRHLRDVLVGGDDFVAQRDHGLQRKLGVVDGRRHRGDVGLAGHGLQALRLALLQRPHRVAARLLQQVGKAAAVARGK